MTVAESEREGQSLGHPDTSEIRDVNVFCKVYSTMQILLQLELNKCHHSRFTERKSKARKRRGDFCKDTEQFRNCIRHPLPHTCISTIIPIAKELQPAWRILSRDQEQKKKYTMMETTSGYSQTQSALFITWYLMEHLENPRIPKPKMPQSIYPLVCLHRYIFISNI